MDYVYLKKTLVGALSGVCTLSTGNLEILIKDTIKLSLTNSINLGNFYSQLETRIVHFQYRKVDGSTREAWGTLKEDLIQKGFRGGREWKTNSLNCITYFDLEKMDWRCLKVENFIGVL